MADLSDVEVTIKNDNGNITVDPPNPVKLNINENKQVKWKFPEDNKDYHVLFPVSPFTGNDFHKKEPSSGKPKKDCLGPGEKEKHFKYTVQADNLGQDPGIIIWK